MTAARLEVEKIGRLEVEKCVIKCYAKSSVLLLLFLMCCNKKWKEETLNLNVLLIDGWCEIRE